MKNEYFFDDFAREKGKFAMNNLEILKSCEAFLEGHFLLSSGRHSSAYCQMAFLQQYPDTCAQVMESVAAQLADTDVDVIVGPAMGGIVYALSLIHI